MSGSGRLQAYTALGVAGIFLGLLLGRPEPVVLGAPFLLLVAAALALHRGSEVTVELHLDSERVIEGERVSGRVAVSASGPLQAARVELSLPRGLRLLTPPGRLAFGLPAGGSWESEVELVCERWGGYRPGELRVAWSDGFGLFRHERGFDRCRPLRVYPSAERLREALAPARTQALAGNQVARSRGEGIEFAEIRPFVAGDRPRRVNWRVTARRGDLHVNEMHLERNADVVVFIDTFVELRAAGASTLDLAVRGAAAILDLHLARRDRVGLLGFGGTLRWLRPAMGVAQLYRLLDSLIDTEVVLSYAWKGVEVIPARVLPPGALVVAFSPLLDERSTAALADLRTRGHDVVVVEVVAEAFVSPGPSETDRLAYRLWEMERAALRARFAQLGIAVMPWRLGRPMQDALVQAREFRRSARLLRA